MILFIIWIVVVVLVELFFIGSARHMDNHT